MSILAERKLVRVQGQLTLPYAFRMPLGLKKGDLVAITETPEGVLITPREVVAATLLDQIGAVLREQGLSLEELVESGRDERAELLRDLHGIDADGAKP